MSTASGCAPWKSHGDAPDQSPSRAAARRARTGGNIVGGVGLPARPPAPGSARPRRGARRTGGAAQQRWPPSGPPRGRRGRVPLAGGEATVLGYNGGLPGPTLHLQPGDRLRLDLANRLSEATNLHVHGLHVSPQGNGDNTFLAIEPGRRSLRLPAPADHPPGVYWYHPHHHGMVADQIFGGLYGAIIVGDTDPDPGQPRPHPGRLRHLPRRPWPGTRAVADGADDGPRR